MSRSRSHIGRRNRALAIQPKSQKNGPDQSLAVPNFERLRPKASSGGPGSDPGFEKTQTRGPAGSEKEGRVMNTKHGGELLKVAEVAERLNFSVPAIRAMVNRGDITGIRVGRNYRIPRRELERILGGIDDHSPPLTKPPRGEKSAPTRLELESLCELLLYPDLRERLDELAPYTSETMSEILTVLARTAEPPRAVGSTLGQKGGVHYPTTGPEPGFKDAF